MGGTKQKVMDNSIVVNALTNVEIFWSVVALFGILALLAILPSSSKKSTK